MKICVCVKHVPDTAASIKLAGDKGFEDSEIKFVSLGLTLYMFYREDQLITQLRSYLHWTLPRKDVIKNTLLMHDY